MNKVFLHVNQLVTLQEAHRKDGRRLVPSDLSIINDGAIAFTDKEILWVGETKNLPAEYSSFESHNLKGHVLTPEMVDSHTHIVFGGDRAQEYADRLNGISYEDIAARGGGILFTMKKTNDASEDKLFKAACEHIERIHSYGVGTIEIKSGYGLNYNKELEISLLINKLKKHFSPRVQIKNTYLAAHDVPKAYSSSSEYLEQVVIPLLEKLAPMEILDAVDIFHEKNYFSKDDVTELFRVAQRLGIPRKIHADELNNNMGATCAVEFHALSADHLLKVSGEGINRLSLSDTVATLLPGTAFFLGKPLAPARAMLDNGCKVAIASDFNPGSCHCDNVLLVASMSAAQLKINQAELWCGITLNASHALGLHKQGALMPGLSPRFSLFQAETLSHLTYKWGQNLAVKIP